MKDKNPKILVVGSNGYIGSHLANKLISEGHSVILSDLSPQSDVLHAPYYQVDFCNLTAVKKVLKGIDIVFFFAGKTGNAQEGFNHPDQFVMGNEVTLVNLLNAIKTLEKKPKIVFPSTRLLYKGNNNGLINETAELSAKSVYAVSKLTCENYLKTFHQTYGIVYTTFRISIPYSGIDSNKTTSGVMSYLINRAQNGKELLIYGEGSQKVSLVHIDDLSNLIALGGFSKKTSNQTYNIGGPDNLSMGEVVRKIAATFKVPVKKVEWPNFAKSAEKGDLILDSSKLLSTLNYTYKHSFGNWIGQLKS